MVRIPEELIGLVAVLTLPLGVLAFLTFGLEAAAVVFVVGWLGLVSGLGVLREWLDENEPAARAGVKTGPEEDTLETLRERYARGEIDEAELERRLEGLVGTEDGPGRPGSGRSAEREREREGEVDPE